MKFSINKATLLSSLQQLNRAVPQRSTLPVLSCVLFELQDSELELRATDLEITMIKRIEVEGFEPGKIAIPIRSLLDITSEMPEEVLEFEISDIGKVVIRSSFGKYTIMGEAPENFPAPQSITTAKEIFLPTEKLSQIIDYTTYAVSREEIKPALQGVYFQVEESFLRTVATDGHRLVRYNLKDVRTGDFTGSVIIPSKFLSVLRQLLSGTEEVHMKVDSNHVQVTMENLILSSRIIDQKYPDYENVIPTDNDKILLLDRAELAASVKRVSIFSNRSTKQISFSLTENTLTIATEDPENITTGRETINCEYSGEPIAIGYNAQYLKEVLNHQPSDQVQIKLKTPVSAGIFVPVDNDEDIITLLMPIR